MRRSRKNSNKTNGVQRRWLGLCQGCATISIPASAKDTRSEQIGKLKEHLSDQDVGQFNEVKRLKNGSAV